MSRLKPLCTMLQASQPQVAGGKDLDDFSHVSGSLLAPVSMLPVLESEMFSVRGILPSLGYFTRDTVTPMPVKY